MKEYKILLVDDHEIIINGIMNALLPRPHFKIVEHVKNGLEVYNACCAYEPDILILDLGLRHQWHGYHSSITSALASNEYSGLHSIPTRVYDH